MEKCENLYRKGDVMSWFHIFSDLLREDAVVFEGLTGELKNIQEELEQLRSGVFISTGLDPLIGQALDKISEQVGSGSENADQLLKALLGSIGLYEYAEKSGQAPAASTQIMEAVRAYAGLDALEELTGQDLIPEEMLQDKESAYSASASVSAWKAEEKWKYGSAKAQAGSAEAYAKAKGGFQFVDNHGFPIPAPFVSAEAGAGVCAFAASAKGKIGNDMIGAQGNVSAEVGSAEAKASLKAQVFDKNGELKPQVSAKAKAEAIAVEAKGTASAHVPGVEASVTGSVNLGVGAHAEFSYKEGKVKAEVGASVLAGASVGVEVDVSEGIAAISDLSSQIDDLFGSSKLTFVR